MDFDVPKLGSVYRLSIQSFAAMSCDGERRPRPNAAPALAVRESTVTGPFMAED
jgi:hypothetical protein